MAEIIQIGDWQIKHKSEWRIPEDKDCDHKHIELDTRGNVVRCIKCGIQVSAFWALELISREYTRMTAKLQRDQQLLNEAKAKELHLLAAKKVEKVWRSRTSVPGCPHCDRGILPEDGLGSNRVDRALELRRRAAEKAK